MGLCFLWPISMLGLMHPMILSPTATAHLPIIAPEAMTFRMWAPTGEAASGNRHGIQLAAAIASSETNSTTAEPSLLPLTLEEAIELAILANPDYQLSLVALERSRASLRLAEAALYPTLSFQGEFERAVSASGQLSAEAEARSLSSSISALQAEIATVQNQLDSLVINDADSIIEAAVLESELQSLRSALSSDVTSLNSNSNFPTTELDGTLTLSYTLFAADRAPTIEAARQTVRIQELEAESALESLRLSVAEAYYGLQLANERVTIATRAVQEGEISVQTAAALSSGGLATRLDVVNAQVELDSDRQTLIQAKGDLATARQSLVQQLNLPPSLTPVAIDPVEPAGEWSLTLEESIELALANRAELEQQIVSRDVNEALRNAALGAQSPSVSLFAEYELLYQNSGEPDSPSKVRGLADGASLGVQVNWDIYDGGSAVAQARQSEADIRTAELTYTSTQNEIRFQVESAYNDLQVNLQNRQIAAESVVLARDALDYSRLRFQAGVGTQTDILRAQDNLTTAESNLAQAILGYNQALATLQRQVSHSRSEDSDPEG
jgi:outer membrane protein TolC